MDKNMKAVLIIGIVVLALGAFAALPGTLAEEDPEEQGRRRWRSYPRLRLLLYILKRGEPVEITAEAVLLEGRILVVNGTQLMNINMPRRWTYDGEPIKLPDLFQIIEGETVNLNTLKIELTRDTHTVTSYFSYELSFDEGTANAILPFNIEG